MFLNNSKMRFIYMKDYIFLNNSKMRYNVQPFITLINLVTLSKRGWKRFHYNSEPDAKEKD